MMLRSILALAAVLLSPAPTFAAGEVSLNSQVLVERQVTDSTGKTSLRLEEPGVVTPGDKLLFSIDYVNRTKDSATDFVVTNPIPASVAFVGEESPGAEVSVDGGKTWGSLASLQVKAADGNLRAASASDVSHVRWAFAKAIAPGATGKLSFRAAVR